MANRGTSRNGNPLANLGFTGALSPPRVHGRPDRSIDLDVFAARRKAWSAGSTGDPHAQALLTVTTLTVI